MSHSMTTISKIVAKVMGVNIAIIKSPARTLPIVNARFMAMFLIKEHLHKSLPEIGRFMGGRDHTSVLHAVRVTEAALKVDVKTSNLYQKCIELMDKENVEALDLSSYPAFKSYEEVKVSLKWIISSLDPVMNELAPTDILSDWNKLVDKFTIKNEKIKKLTGKELA